MRRRALTIHPLTGCPLLAVAAYWLIYRAEEHQVRTRDLQRVGLNSKQGGLDSAAKVAPLHSATTKINTWWEVVLAKASEELGLLVIDDTNLRRRYPNFPLLSDLRDKMLAQQEPSTKELDPFRLKYIDPFGRCRRRKGAHSSYFRNVCYHGGQVSSGGCTTRDTDSLCNCAKHSC